jgi:hypothetical protein
MLLTPSPGRGRSALGFAGKLLITFQPARIEPAVFRCAAHRTPRFVPVTAVSESAFSGQGLNIYECPAKTTANRANLQFAHSGSVD